MVDLTALMASIITGVLSLVGVLVSNRKSETRTMHNITVAQMVTDEKLSELTREVRAHNEFATRIPVVEEKIKVINHRIDDLEAYHK